MSLVQFKSPFPVCMRPNMERNNYTPEEPWSERMQSSWYEAACEFALAYLEDAKGECLVVGSPTFEARALEERGLAITYLDCRKAPWPGAIQADASAMPFGAERFDVLSSTCVVCHAGLGRYGDKVNFEHGDAAVLTEMRRVMKLGGRAAMMIGPVANLVKEHDYITMNAVHRVYSLERAVELVTWAGFRLKRYAIHDARGQRWRRLDEPINIDLSLFPDCLCMGLEAA